MQTAPGLLDLYSLLQVSVVFFLGPIYQNTRIGEEVLLPLFSYHGLFSYYFSFHPALYSYQILDAGTPILGLQFHIQPSCRGFRTLLINGGSGPLTLTLEIPYTHEVH